MLTTETFFKELQRIILSQPKLPNHILFSENCLYGDFIFWCKNMTYCFDCAKSNDCLYIYDSIMMVNCVDCDYGAESELCYECVDPFKCFNCHYLENCVNMRDSAFCYACFDCHDVFGCVNLRNKSYCLFNRQLTKEEYQEKVKKFQALSVEKDLQLLADLEKKYPWTQANASSNENSLYGNYIYQCKNSYFCFDAFQDKDCTYMYDSHQNSNCSDFTYTYESELTLEGVDSDNLFHCGYIVYSDKCQDSNFIFNCQDCQFCLGCVGLSHKKYCILNRQFSKEDYEKLSSQILQELKDNNLGWEELIF